jgi:hypothetical protein
VLPKRTGAVFPGFTAAGIGEKKGLRAKGKRIAGPGRRPIQRIVQYGAAEPGKMAAYLVPEAAPYADNGGMNYPAAEIEPAVRRGIRFFYGKSVVR